MALRQGLQCLSRTVVGPKGFLPLRSGGGPLKPAKAPEQPLELWDEMWWRDGQKEVQPILDHVGVETLWPVEKSTAWLLGACGVLAAFVVASNHLITPITKPFVPPQYPAETLAKYGPTVDTQPFKH